MRRDEYLLPEDMHFSSRQLLRLFLKPKFALRNRPPPTNSEDGEIDETYWAQQAPSSLDSAPDDMDLEPAFEYYGGGDDEDEVLIDETLEADDDDLRATTGELRHAKRDNVQYAKKAKRVDVKRLKDDIWNDLRALVDEPTPGLETDEGESEPEPQVTTPVKTFDSVIQSLRSNYPREKMSEISTSFCFICLLHLANEEGLRIETARTDGTEGMDVGLRGYADIEGEPLDSLGEMERSDRIVGELQALKVFKVSGVG